MESYEFIRPDGAKTGEFSSWVIEDDYVAIKKNKKADFLSRGLAADKNICCLLK